jgi:hypothetical protein
MSTVALHPSERAALRLARRRWQRRAWARAAAVATPIVMIIGLPVIATLPSLLSAQRGGQTSAGVVSNSKDANWAAQIASPGRGVTGTAELPPEPVDGSALAFTTSAGVTPALPFSIRGINPLDRARATECLTAAIYYEAASEPDDGQRAVAQVVLNRVRHPAFPSTVCGVVYQGAHRGTGCQFSFACDGASARIPSRAGWARAARIAATALSGYVFSPVGLATHYHTYAVTPAWNRTLVMTDAIGAHFFHRWKGFWGTPLAFRQRYVGREPLAGPAAPASISPIIAISHPVRVVPAAAPAPQVRPEHEDSGTALVTPSQNKLPESQVLDRWKDAGKPLR